MSKTNGHTTHSTTDDKVFQNLNDVKVIQMVSELKSRLDDTTKKLNEVSNESHLSNELNKQAIQHGEDATRQLKATIDKFSSLRQRLAEDMANLNGKFTILFWFQGAIVTTILSLVAFLVRNALG